MFQWRNYGIDHYLKDPRVHNRQLNLIIKCFQILKFKVKHESDIKRNSVILNNMQLAKKPLFLMNNFSCQDIKEECSLNISIQMSWKNKWARPILLICSTKKLHHHLDKCELNIMKAPEIQMSANGEQKGRWKE